jgi:Tat protein secretion system quality control protein TatD with DNase activity
MQTIDIHTHLLSSEVTFNRFYDKLAIRFFAKKFGMDPKALMQNPSKAYKVEEIPVLGTGKADFKGAKKLALELSDRL